MFGNWANRNDKKREEAQQPTGALARVMKDIEAQREASESGISSDGMEDYYDYSMVDEEEFFAQLNAQTEETMRNAEMTSAPIASEVNEMDDDSEGVAIVPMSIAPYVPTIPELPSYEEMIQDAAAQERQGAAVDAAETATQEDTKETALDAAREAAQKANVVRDYDTMLVQPDDEVNLDAAARALAAGEVVGMPTETVYGLGCNALMPEAVEKVYKAKGRPSDNPLIVHIASKDMIPQLTSEVTPIAQVLIDAFMPGPITIIMRKAPIVPDVVTAGRDTVGVRFPIHAGAQELIKRSGVPIAAPSANLSGSPSPTKAEHVMKDMDGRIPYILEGGECQVGLESTVVDATGNWPQILRPGAITMSLMEQALTAAGFTKPEEVIEREMKPGEAPMAPGMKYRHYAPSCEVKILGSGDTANYAEYYKQAVMRAIIDGMTPVGVFVDGEIANMLRAYFPNKLDDILIYEYGEIKDVHEAAHGLFDGLRTLDEQGAKVIYAPAFPAEEMGLAYMNRLNKAAAGKTETTIQKTRSEVTRRILFVCSGNTCRSPLAEVVMRSLWKKYAPHFLTDHPETEVLLEASSAGVFADEGTPFTLDSVRVANFKYDEDISDRTSVQLTPDMVAKQDLVLCMTNDISRRIRIEYPGDGKNVFSFQEKLSSLFIPDVSGEILDPYGQDYLVYQRTAEQLERVLNLLLPEIMKEWGTK